MRNIHKSGAKSTRWVIRARKNLSSTTVISKSLEAPDQSGARLKHANVGRESAEMIHCKQAVDNRTVVRFVLSGLRKGDEADAHAKVLWAGMIHLPTSRARRENTKHETQGLRFCL